jgi:hypothetical protein
VITATVSRRFIDGGVNERGDTIEVSEARFAELVRMNLVVNPVTVETSEPADDAGKKGKK